MSNTSPTVQGATWRWMVSCWSVCRGCSASKAPLSVLRLLASGFWSSLWHVWIKLIFYIHHSNSQPHSQSAFHTQDTQVHPHPQIHAPVINRSNIYPASSSPTLSDPLPEWWLKKKKTPLLPFQVWRYSLILLKQKNILYLLIYYWQPSM